MAISRRTPLQEVGGETFEAGDGGAVERTPLTGLFEVRRRGRVTYYTQPGGIISSLVTVRDGMGDLTIHFAGLTGGTSVTNRDYLGPPGSRARAPAGRGHRAGSGCSGASTPALPPQGTGTTWRACRRRSFNASMHQCINAVFYACCL